MEETKDKKNEERRKKLNISPITAIHSSIYLLYLAIKKLLTPWS
jgi:hypothetical protein